MVKVLKSAADENDLSLEETMQRTDRPVFRAIDLATGEETP
jgi:hypothetical protein